jgi:uncharacterized protein (TIGR00369 family)
VFDAAAAQELLETTPFSTWWGFRVVSVGQGTATVVLPLQPHLLRPGDIAHGGCAMTLADVATWIALIARTGRIDAVTTQQNTTFLGPARGDLSCRATVIKAGRTFSHSEATVTDSTGRLVSHHTVSYANPPLPAAEPG